MKLLWPFLLLVVLCNSQGINYDLIWQPKTGATEYSWTQCDSVNCDFEEGRSCRWKVKSYANQGQFKLYREIIIYGQPTGLKPAQRREVEPSISTITMRRKFLAQGSYLLAGSANANPKIAVTHLDFDASYGISFLFFKTHQEVNIRGCCDHSGDCPFHIRSVRSDHYLERLLNGKWRKGFFTCPKGTKYVSLECSSNNGQGVCGFDDIQLVNKVRKPVCSMVYKPVQFVPAPTPTVAPISPKAPKPFAAPQNQFETKESTESKLTTASSPIFIPANAELYGLVGSEQVRAYSEESGLVHSVLQPYVPNNILRPVGEIGAAGEKFLPLLGSAAETSGRMISELFPGLTRFIPG